MTQDKGQPWRDAFGRQRVGAPFTLFDSKQIYDNQSLFWDDQEVSGTATTSVHDLDRASSTLGVAASTAGRRLCQTFRRFNYQPGKSQLVILTGLIGTGVPGVSKKVGYFDDDNGLFFEQDGDTLYVVQRSNVTGTPVDTRVAQSDWNLDRLNDDSVVGDVLDITKFQIFTIDFEWLGSGRVRFGFWIDGQLVYCHQFKNANTLDSVYMSTPNLPVRWEIEADGVNGVSASLEQGCATVISEGGQEHIGKETYVSTSGTHLNANVADTLYAAIGIRLKTTHLGLTVELQQVSMISETADDFEWIVVLNPTIAGAAPTFASVTNSGLQFALGATVNTVTLGSRIAGGWVKSGTVAGGAFIKDIDSALKLGAAIDNTRDEIWLCVRPLSINLDLQSSLTLRELL